MLLVWRRYQGPHVWDLPVDALRAAPVEWERFLHGGSLQAAYNVPDSTAMLLERLDENVVTYLVRCPSNTQVSIGWYTCKQGVITGTTALLPVYIAHSGGLSWRLRFSAHLTTVNVVRRFIIGRPKPPRPFAQANYIRMAWVLLAIAGCVVTGGRATVCCAGRSFQTLAIDLLKV